MVVAGLVLAYQGLAPAGGGPHSDHGARIVDRVAAVAVAGQVADGDLQGDGVDVDLGGGVDAGHLGQARQAEGGVQVRERAQDAEVEDRAEVDVEALGALAGEHAAPVAEVVHGGVGECGVVGGGERSDVARRAAQVASDLRGAPGGFDAGDRVGLAAVPVRGVERLDGAGVVQEGVLVRHRGGEAELVGHVRAAVAVVVDVDLVEDVVAELVEVRAAVRALQRQVVGDQGDGVGLVGADECVEVGAVGDGVLGDLRRFAVGGHGCSRISAQVVGEGVRQVRRCQRPSRVSCAASARSVIVRCPCSV